MNDEYTEDDVNLAYLSGISEGWNMAAGLVRENSGQLFKIKKDELAIFCRDSAFELLDKADKAKEIWQAEKNNIQINTDNPVCAGGIVGCTGGKTCTSSHK